jgi:hypothetical protein
MSYGALLENDTSGPPHAPHCTQHLGTKYYGLGKMSGPVACAKPETVPVPGFTHFPSITHNHAFPTCKVLKPVATKFKCQVIFHIVLVILLTASIFKLQHDIA